MVVGAAYSHADNLKFESLYASSFVVLDGCTDGLLSNTYAAVCSRSLSGSTSRPRTPPSGHSTPNRLTKSHDASTPPPKPSSGLSSPPLKQYFNFLSTTNQDWDTEDDPYSYDDGDDGDDFGLPSLSNMRRRTRRQAAQQGGLPEAGLGGLERELGIRGAHARRMSDSADIAVERPPLPYFVPKKSEGKILRPQYKDILRGQPHSFPYAKHLN